MENNVGINALNKAYQVNTIFKSINETLRNINEIYKTFQISYPEDYSQKLEDFKLNMDKLLKKDANIEEYIEEARKYFMDSFKSLSIDIKIYNSMKKKMIAA